MFHWEEPRKQWSFIHSSDQLTYLSLLRHY
jgi:hypothetical protein